MQSNPFALQEWYETNETQLGQLTELVRGKLTSLQRKIIVALVTTDVHARDIVEGLVKDNV
jgi:dynein heavy chain